MTVQDLQTGLVYANDALKLELALVQANLKTAKEQLCQDSGNIKQDLRPISEDLRALEDMKPEVTTLKEEFNVDRDNLKQEISTVAKGATAIQANEIQKLTDVCEGFRQDLDTVKKGLDGLQSSVRADVV